MWLFGKKKASLTASFSPNSEPQRNTGGWPVPEDCGIRRNSHHRRADVIIETGVYMRAYVLGLLAMSIAGCSDPVTAMGACQKLVAAGVASNCRMGKPGGLNA